MGKMILYWKSNSKTELEFYRVDQKRNTCLSDENINIRIAEAFEEMDDDDDECDTKVKDVSRNCNIKTQCCITCM